MEDNWYEAAVTAHHPHKIISVVDWASDASDSHIAPIPKKPKKPTRAESATYNVFAWGVNDPEVGNRTIEKEGADKLASPLGWHSIPAQVDPNSVGKQYEKDQVNNYTSTWGNNVRLHEFFIAISRFLIYGRSSRTRTGRDVITGRKTTVQMLV